MTLGQRVATPARMLRSYVVPGNALEFGASLGNAHCWLTTHGNGSIQDFFSTDIGQTIANTIAVRYGGIGHHLLDAGADATTLTADTTTVQLRPVSPGSIQLHPAYQRHSFVLPVDVQVHETVFVPLSTGDDPAVAYYQVELANTGDLACVWASLWRTRPRSGGAVSARSAGVGADQSQPACRRTGLWLHYPGHGLPDNA
jgi:hypothetical protein